MEAGAMTKKREPYHQVEDGDWIATKRKGNFEQCCDCGLVHVTDYRLNKSNQLEYRTRRHGRATGGARSRFREE